MSMQKNALGQDIGECSCKPMTGWYRDGSCKTDEMDRGSHTVCGIVTEEFLEFALSKGNDLITPAPQYNFPGLKPGDSWCICARTWLDALNHGKACPVDLEATNIKALEIIPLELLEDRAV
tara:strand:- start:78 stop:440 length:363 start_codon:yes stop_codon:yes gene_type:complete